MRKVQLKYASSSVIGVVAAAIIVFAGVRAWVAGDAPSTTGARLFQENGCSQCHFTESRETKIGPGLAGLFERDNLPVSERPVTEQNVKDQMIDPYGNMPSFEDKLTGREIDAVVSYLKTL
ncbi:MAG: cytochrome c [Desulfobacterales bacterium]